MKPNIVFLTVQNSKEKCLRLGDYIENAFSKGDRVLIYVGNQAVADFVDKLLWTFREESFLPHTLSEKETSDSIVITQTAKNINRATILFNLTSQVPDHIDEFKHVYELKDETSTEKFERSRSRYNQYQLNKYSVAIL